LGAWIPGIYLTVAYLTNNLTINPIQELTQQTGYTALILLVLSLACTPANSLFGWRQALKLRRPLGLYAFLYALTHFLIFAGLDYGFDLTFLPDAILEKPFVLIGSAALLILAILAATSFQWWMKRLGKNWKRLHKLVYLAAPLVLVHFTWSQKGDLARLQGDILRPVVFSLIVCMLLALRIPAIRRRLANVRQNFTARALSHQEKNNPPQIKKSRAELEIS
jgi:sulfoxide reductase heme-binding subunit YedZ